MSSQAQDMGSLCHWRMTIVSAENSLYSYQTHSNPYTACNQVIFWVSFQTFSGCAAFQRSRQQWLAGLDLAARKGSRLLEDSNTGRFQHRYSRYGLLQLYETGIQKPIKQHTRKPRKSHQLNPLKLSKETYWQRSILRWKGQNRKCLVKPSNTTWLTQKAPLPWFLSWMQIRRGR